MTHFTPSQPMYQLIYCATDEGIKLNQETIKEEMARLRANGDLTLESFRKTYYAEATKLSTMKWEASYLSNYKPGRVKVITPSTFITLPSPNAQMVARALL